jgi:hypothetical protein
MSAVRHVLIASLLLLGASFLYAGLGIDILIVELSGVASYGLIIGITLLLLSLLIAQPWEGRSSTQMHP